MSAVSAPAASFRFDRYVISSSEIKIEDNTTSEWNLDINPRGKLSMQAGEFVLFLDIHVYNQTVDMKFMLKGFFSFDLEQDEKELRDFITINAPAILFPYLRAYVTTVCTLSGAKAIVLPTLNMMRIYEELKDNIEEK